MTSRQAWRWVAHHWAWGLLRFGVMYVDIADRALRRIPIRVNRDET